MSRAPRGRKPNRERHRQAAELRRRGWTLRAIGRRLGITYQRVVVILRTSGLAVTRLNGTRRAARARAVEESRAVGGKHADFSQQICHGLRGDGGGNRADPRPKDQSGPMVTRAPRNRKSRVGSRQRNVCGSRSRSRKVAQDS
jgi:hypothetical protein